MTAVVRQANEVLGGPRPLQSHGNSLAIVFQWLLEFIVEGLKK